MTEFRQRLILLKPMRPGLSGYARLQSERGGLWVQLNARGLEAGTVQAFWYGAGGEARLMASARVNAHGEASLVAEAPADLVGPERLQALLVLDGGETPSPLMIGLCVQQSAGSLLDAKNAALALCDRLARQSRAKNAPPADAKAGPPPQNEPARPRHAGPCPEAAPAERPPSAKQAPIRPRRGAEAKPWRPPREIFLPAIDPLAHLDAARRAAGQDGPDAPPRRGADDVPGGLPAQAPPEPTCTHDRAGEDFAPPPKRPAADRLRPLAWPRGFETLRPYFEKGMPCRLFDLPGWRFVHAAQSGGPDGLWVGMCQTDGRVCRVAYALRSNTPPPGGAYRPARGVDGHTYQVLWQRV